MTMSMSGLINPIETARTYLYVPATRPDRFDKAVASGADAVIIDLEDAVPAADRDGAREAVVAWCSDGDADSVWVRINHDRAARQADLVALQNLPIAGVVVPKADLQDCASVPHPTYALIESAAGLVALHDIAQLPNVVRLGIGEADLARELGIDPSPDRHELWPIRMQLVVASAAAGIASPIGPVYLGLDDPDGLAETTMQLRRQGFGARTALHPRQVEAIHAAMAPTAEQREWARTVSAAFAEAEEGVVVVNGEFVDEAVVRRALSILSRAKAAD